MATNVNSGQQHGIGAVPNNLDPTTRTFLAQIKNALVKTAGSPVAARKVTNVKVTPGAFSNTIQYTMTDADYYTIYASPTNDISKATILDAGKSNEFNHFVGAPAITRFYWVQACVTSVEKNSDPVGPISGTSLASGTSAPVPTPPPSPDIPVIDSTTGQVSRSGGRNVPSIG